MPTIRSVFIPLVVISLCIVLGKAGAIASLSTAAESPNVIFIIADDFGWGDVGCYGNPDLDAPVLDRLAAAGLPHRRGFDRFVGFANGAHDLWQWQLERRTATRDGQAENTQIEAANGRHLSEVLAAEAIDFVGESAAADRTFVVVYAAAAIHPPLQAAEPLIEKYARRLGDRGDQTVAITYAMIEQLDTGIDRLLGAVDAAGLREQTLVILASDNGANLRWSGKNVVQASFAEEVG